MARPINLLTAREVATVAKPGKYADGGGLYLIVRERGTTLERLWTFRFKRGGRGAAKETSLSIGPARDISLAAARAQAAKCRLELEHGRDPRGALKGGAGPSKTFGEVADALIETLEDGFKSEATRANWRRTLGERYCRRLRAKPVRDVSTEDVLEALKPIWLSKPETARKMRGRIERVLDAARVQGLRDGENPARWRGHLKHILPEQTGKRGHHRALPWEALPDFMRRLRLLSSVSAQALEFTILTVVRTAEAAEAPRSEINREQKVWVIPPERTKSGREHRVPLCDRCLEIYDELAAFDSDWLFPGRQPKEHLSLSAMSECLKHLGDDATVHGFRSTFRDWAGDHTSFPRELAEAVMAHVVGDQAERAYRRKDALERRRKMMLAWERYCLSKLGEAKELSYMGDSVPQRKPVDGRGFGPASPQRARGMKIADIKKGDVLVHVDKHGAGFYRVVKVNRVSVDVVGENGNKVRAYPHIFDRKVQDVAALQAEGIRV